MGDTVRVGMVGLGWWRSITDGERPETGGPEGLEVVAVLEAIVAGAASGRREDVRDFRG